MTVNNQPKVPMAAAKTMADLGASQGARRASEDAPRSAAPAEPASDSAEVVPRARRRQFSRAEKRRIVQAADACTQPGEIGALMRREGVYSSSLSTWRRQLEAADLAALAPQKRGPKVDPGRADTLQIAQLTRDNDKLRIQLEKAQLVIDVQKKVASLLALLEQNNKPGSS